MRRLTFETMPKDVTQCVLYSDAECAVAAARQEEREQIADYVASMSTIEFDGDAVAKKIREGRYAD